MLAQIFFKYSLAIFGLFTCSTLFAQHNDWMEANLYDVGKETMRVEVRQLHKDRNPEQILYRHQGEEAELAPQPGLVIEQAGEFRFEAAQAQRFV